MFQTVAEDDQNRITINQWDMYRQVNGEIVDLWKRSEASMMFIAKSLMRNGGLPWTNRRPVKNRKVFGKLSIREKKDFCVRIVNL